MLFVLVLGAISAVCIARARNRHRLPATPAAEAPPSSSSAAHGLPAKRHPTQGVGSTQAAGAESASSTHLRCAVAPASIASYHEYNEAAMLARGQEAAGTDDGVWSRIRTTTRIRQQEAAGRDEDLWKL